MPVTYEPIATTTLGSAAAEINFSSISSAYTDLRLIVRALHATSSSSVYIQLNGDTATNYSRSVLSGDGTSASSFRNTSSSFINIGDSYMNTTAWTFITVDLFSYAGSTNKTCLINTNTDRNGTGSVVRSVGLWRSTSAISSIKVYTSSDNFAIGTTATLYGILKA